MTNLKTVDADTLMATPLPADHYVGGDAATRTIDGPRAECITCHPVSQE